MALMMDFAIGLAAANSLILAGLIYLYAKIATRTRAAYSLGLVFFALLLLLQNLLTVLAYATMSPFFGEEALPFLSGIGALEFGGLLVLLKLTL